MGKERLSPLKWFAKYYKGEDFGDYSWSILMDAYADYSISLLEPIRPLKDKIKKFDKELNIAHQALSECYEYDTCVSIVRKCLDKIDRLNKRPSGWLK